jgi:hypothetical protein
VDKVVVTARVVQEEDNRIRKDISFK